MSAGKDLYILLRAKDMASKTIKGVSKNVSGLGSAANRVGGALKTMAVGAAAIGTTVIAANVKAGIDSLAELESATTSVAGALSQMGLAGQVTADQVATWANEIEAATDAAFDDKAITAAAATLIRYGKVTPKTLRPAMEVMTDLAARTGDVKTAGELLAKALADPAKAAGKLSRYGIILTKTQQDQIKAMVKGGKTAQAQAMLLDILAKSTKGAAAASAGPYQDAMNKLGDAVEDAQRALAIGFLPVIQEVADWLGKELVKPSTISAIREFGKGLAGGLKSAVTWARQLPWDKIVDGLQSAAGFAKGLIDAFMAMPTEVKGTIIALAGLNKLSGGAVSGIVGELGKGLVKGVLGVTAGVVNINAGVVNGGGGLPGGASPKGGTGTFGSLVKGAAKLILPFLPAAIAIGASEALSQQRDANVAGMATPDLQKYVAQLQHSIDNPGYGPIGARRQQQDMAELARAMRELGARTDKVVSGTNTVSHDIRNGFMVNSSSIRNGFSINASRIGGVGRNTSMALTAMGRINASTAGVRTSVAQVRSAVATDTAVLRSKNFKPRVAVTVKNNISVRNYEKGASVHHSYTTEKGG